MSSKMVMQMKVLDMGAKLWSWFGDAWKLLSDILWAG